MQYDAFISYSHEVDRTTARSLQLGLQKLAKPWYRRRNLRVFRDESNLSASPSLWSSIQQALESSRFLIVVASPAAALSPWVNREIEEWKRVNGTGQILTVVTGGRWAWDPGAGDFSVDSDAVPPALRKTFDAEPFYLDLRSLRNDTALTLRHSAFRSAIASLAAPVHGKDKDALEGDDIREHRRALRLAWGAAGGLAALAIATSVASVLAVNNAARANERARIALARQLALEAVSLKDQRLDLALLLAAQSQQVANTVEGRASVMTVLAAQPQLVTYFRGHSDIILDLAFSANDSVLASASDDGRLVLWDLGSGEPAVLAERPTGFTSVDFSVDGQWLAAGNRNGTVTLWDLSLRPAREVIFPRRNGAVFDLAFHPDAKRLAVAGADGFVELWNVTSATLERRIGKRTRDTLGGIWSVTFGGGGRFVAAMDQSGTVRVWNVETGSEGSGPPSSGVAHLGRVAFVSDLVVAEPRSDGRVRLWNTVASRESSWLGSALMVSRLGSFGGVLGLTYNAAANILATSSADGTVSVWDLKTSEPLVVSTGGPAMHQLRGHRAAAWSAAFSRDGHFLVTGDAKGTIIVWSVSLTRGLGSLLPDTVGSLAVAFRPDGAVVASGSPDGSVVLWNAESGQPLPQLLLGHKTAVADIAFRPDGRVLVSADASGRAISWNLETEPPTSSPVAIDAQTLRTAAYSSDAAFLALGGAAKNPDSAGNRGAVFLFDASSLEPVGRPIYADPDVVEGVAFSPDARSLASAGGNGRVSVWDVRSRLAVRTPVADEFGSSYEVAYHPNGRLVAVGRSVPEIALWDFQRRTAPVEPLAGHREAVMALSFSPEGNTLASGSLDGTIRLWDVERGLALGGPLDLHSAVFDIAFSPDGRRLASAGPEGVALWDLSAEDLLVRVCHVANRNLSGEEWELYLGGGTPYRRTCASLPDGDGVGENERPGRPGE